MHVAERGVDAALGGDRVTPRGEELGNAGRVEASLGQAEGGAQTGAAGTDDERIVLMVLVQPKVNSLCPSDTARIAAEATYDDGVFAADERRCLLRPERPVGEDAGYRQKKTQISTRSLACSPPTLRQELGSTYQPVVLWKRPGSGHARAAEWTSG